MGSQEKGWRWSDPSSSGSAQKGGSGYQGDAAEWKEERRRMKPRGAGVAVEGPWGSRGGSSGRCGPRSRIYTFAPPAADVSTASGRLHRHGVRRAEMCTSGRGTVHSTETTTM
ncbi:hypothetical protein E2562_020582 [Oryza meyeriana var. granulata]|uniref:Uncharacterized protein n=1 Tax=Oryza meyeriana var. granulata TaxID=110450 RepID=A0A6G1DYN8_9ORYZ|nr:hypothetical protein E2562_020582 [Oryza meyeriana var. granulata]